jgi:hypothetical protein
VLVRLTVSTSAVLYRPTRVLASRPSMARRRTSKSRPRAYVAIAFSFLPTTRQALVVRLPKPCTVSPEQCHDYVDQLRTLGISRSRLGHLGHLLTITAETTQASVGSQPRCGPGG